MARLTRDDAGALGLMVYPLLTWNFQRSAAVVIKEDTVVTHLVYGIDDFQGTELVRVDPSVTSPPEVTICSKNQSYLGVPLRPLYYDVVKGMSRRAIPIDWRCGVSYDEWRQKVQIH